MQAPYSGRTRGQFASAEIIVRSSQGTSSVKVDGETVLSGRTFFPPGVVETSETSSADINLNKLGKVSLSPSSALDLGFDDDNVPPVVYQERFE